MASYNNVARSNLSLSFVSHGEITMDEYFIVPTGFTINVYTKSGKPLLVSDMITEYYKDQSIDNKHEFKSGDVIRNVQMILDPFLIKKEYKTLKMINYLPYMGPLPTVLSYRKLKSVEKPINDFTLKYPVFANIKDDDALYKQYLQVYKYLKKQNNYQRIDEEEYRDNIDKFIGSTLGIDSDELKSKSSSDYIDLLIKAIQKNPEKYKDDFYYVENNDKNMNIIRNEVNTKNNKNKFLFDPVAKSPASHAKLEKLFADCTNDKISIFDVINELKPGTYNFYLCRVFKGPLELEIQRKSRIGLLTRTRSINNSNNNNKHNSRKSTKKNGTGKINKSSPVFTNFGGNNGKIVIIARFFENIIKQYFNIENKNKEAIVKISRNNIGNYNSFEFYHALLLSCTLDYINCSQSITIKDKDIINELKLEYPIGVKKYSIINPKPTINTKHLQILPSMKISEKLSIKATQNSLKSQGNIIRQKTSKAEHNYKTKFGDTQHKNRVYTNLVNITAIDGLPIKKVVFNHQMQIISVERLHSINNIILGIYAFIKNILLNKDFHDILDSGLSESYPEQLENLKKIFTKENLTNVLLNLEPSDTPSDILEYFENVFKIHHKSYFYDNKTSNT